MSRICLDHQHMGVRHHLTKQFYVVLSVFFILTDAMARAQVNVEPNTAVLNEGDPTELLCRYAHHSITYCRIEIPGEPKVFNLSPDWNKTPGFTYFGKGLQNGECGVNIQRVKAINNGQVKCNLGVEGEELSGTIDLVVALRPKQPAVELMTKADSEGYFSEGVTFQARCIVPDGRPAGNITWFLDNEPANKPLGQMEFVASHPANTGLELATTIQSIKWNLGPEDNGRKLICRSHHQTDRESLPPQEGSYTILVRYAPIHKEDTTVYGLYLEQTVKVNMTIRANPAPVIEWTIDGEVVRQGEQKGRFSVFEPEYLGQDMYNVTMIIAGLTLEDTTKTYILRASNALGTTDYNVHLSSSATPPSSGLEIGAIVGIVVAVAVLILIVLLVLFARATGRWCFGGKSVKMTTNETDTESAEVKATSTATATTAAASEVDANGQMNADSCNKKSKRLPSFSAIFKRMNERDVSAKRKNNEADTSNNGNEVGPTPTPAVATTAGSGTNEQLSPDGATDGNDNQPKEDKQLVYAELVLKPAENNEPLPPPKPSTEYAEIVYVKKDDKK
ncbi:fasciclin-3 isoform X3 [Stomoxys calcitrans]|uniref:fasciclin-3 isoform X3 n=1 Tax=Stomoxys calcitrans TaxID=35570 RepID=UPI0027E2B9D5|nr:fasciclin-3 isoform X3 [Stomoxys calcitrans]